MIKLERKLRVFSCYRLKKLNKSIFAVKILINACNSILPNLKQTMPGFFIPQ